MGTVAFVSEDISAPGEWYCTQAHEVVEGFEALEWVESEVWKLLARRLRLPAP